MKLYHGTNLSIDAIDLDRCRKWKDFGKGFYTTELPEQAEKMAKRVARIYGGDPVVHVYEFDESALSDPDLHVRVFDSVPNEAWARFVMNNRNKDYAGTDCNSDAKYDIVVGPIADDDMAVLFRQFENELITLEMLVSGMTYKKLTNQYSFHTPRACRLLQKDSEVWL